MGKIVWLASYPRSGNTWMRFLLANLLKGKAVEHSAEGNLLVPDIHDGITGAHLYGPRTTIVKTHWAWRPDLPLREDVVGALHLIRNPIDVMESNLNYAMTRSGDFYERSTDGDRQRQADAFIEGYIAQGGHSRFRQFGIGSWEEHTKSWGSTPASLPRLTLRYEDIVADTAGGLQRICRFLTLEKSAEEIALAVANSTKEAQRDMEDREIAAGREGVFYQRRNAAAYAAGRRFVDRTTGKAGDQAGNFRASAAQKARAAERFAPLMRALGYDPTIQDIPGD
jgi:hypothetical protein